MIADLDGQQLRAFLAGRGGRTTVRIGGGPRDLATGRGGIVTSFSSAGLTAFGHLLKPDVGAPGGQILSATLPIAGGPFAVFDGTSMAAPHVAGAAALLLQRHPNWSPQQVKSALVSTAAPAWADTARTVEAPVLTAGSGEVDLLGRERPEALHRSGLALVLGPERQPRRASRSRCCSRSSDAGDGAGTWTIEVKAQSQPSGVQIVVPGAITIAPGGERADPRHRQRRRERRRRRGVRLPAAAPRHRHAQGRRTRCS